MWNSIKVFISDSWIYLQLALMSEREYNSLLEAVKELKSELEDQQVKGSHDG